MKKPEQAENFQASLRRQVPTILQGRPLDRVQHVQRNRVRLHVPQRKTGTPLVLPLTDAVGTVLLRYLRRARPASPHRQLFLRERAPAGVLKPTAVTEVFQKWVRRSGLPIPFQGPHCLRHSYAVALLRRGVGLKTLGDLLGHRTADSTCAYLRLATDDLREVALAVPRAAASRGRR